MAAKTVSVSYKLELDTATLSRALVNGELPKQYIAHIGRLLDETPIPSHCYGGRRSRSERPCAASGGVAQYLQPSQDSGFVAQARLGVNHSFYCPYIDPRPSVGTG
jgi:hypothetical protein